MFDRLLSQAERNLRQNWQEVGCTIPTSGLYPFQWMWDSGFCAMGLAHFDIEKAMQEIDTLFKGQWANGFLPHIIFHDDTQTSYYPGADVHNAMLHPASPKHVKTTGMTQPPVVGFILWQLYEIVEDKAQLLPFLKRNFPKVMALHRYLYTHRDPKGEGLVYIQHNWESGADNSPIWDAVWHTFEAPNYTLPRRDIQHVNAAQRPTHREYEYYIYLIELFKEWRYDDAEIAAKSPFLVQDPMFNTILAYSNLCMIELAKIIGEEEAIPQLQAWYDATKQAMNSKLFDEELGGYVHYDLRNECPIRMLTSSSMVALFAGIPSAERAQRMVEVLQSPVFRGKHNEYRLVASFNTQDSRFDAARYWRGPVWLVVNWMIMQGLLRYNADELAAQIREDSLQLITENSFAEYFDPFKGERGHTKGYGGKNFSWTSAIVIDLIKRHAQLVSKSD